MEWIPLVQFSLSRPAIFCLANNIIMKGYEGCGSLHKDHAGPKADGKHIAIVLSTAQAQNSDLDQRFQVNGTDYDAT